MEKKSTVAGTFLFILIILLGVGFIVFEISLFLLTAPALDSFFGDILVFLVVNAFILSGVIIFYGIMAIIGPYFAAVTTIMLMLFILYFTPYVYLTM